MTSRPHFTPQQSAAILTQGVSIALSAGAGCGKTFVLTQRFLAGLDPTNESAADLHSLVAITFTERAAREMRDRIRAACDERLKSCPGDEVDHWLGVLRGLDSARISTIHSFCTSLLRSQAVEAGIDPRFSVLEPALADTLLRHVVRDTFHGLLESGHDDAVRFVVQFGLERARELLRRLVAQRFQIDFAAFAETTPEQLTGDWLRRWRTEFVPKLIAAFRESPTVERVLTAIQGAPSKHAKMIERIANLGAILPARTPWADPAQSLEAIRENARVQGGGGKKDWASEEQQEEIKLAFESLRQRAKDLGDCLNFREEDVAAAAETACRALRLTELLANEYAAAKVAQGVLDFDDLLLHARNLLRDNESVRHRIAAGIRLLMVDEFQDTDPVQADVVRSLCGAALTRGKLFMVGDRKQSIYRFRRADPTVFATMSDELPASGRLPLNVNFRSQPAVLNFVNQLFAPAMDGYEHLVPFRDEQFSPTPAIEFLLATFDAEGADAAPSVEELSGEDDLRPNAAQLRAREADWIARRIQSLLNDSTPRIRTKELDANGRPRLRRVEPGDIVILFRALSSVQEYESALRRYGLDYYLVGGKAFFAQQEVFDLLNLCRYLDDCDDHVGLVGVLRSPFLNLSDDAIHALALHTSAAAESRPLAPREESRSTLDAVLASGARQTQDVQRETGQPLAEREGDFPPASRATLTLHETLYLPPPSFLPEDQRSRIRFAAEVLSELRAQKDRIPLSDLLNRAIEMTGYDASLLAEFLGARKLANLRKLIEMARQFDQGEFFTLKDFVTRLQTSVLEETDEEFATTLPESGEVIRLMSIHQSKGLEFPVVVVADIDRKGPPRGSDAVLHPLLGPLLKFPKQFGTQTENLALKMHILAEEEADAEETIRLFYVACTRAADYLILSAGYDADKSTHSPWMELVSSRFDIRTGLPRFDPLLGASEFATADRETVPEVFVHHQPCAAKIDQSSQVKQIPIGQLPGSVLAAEPCELPISARAYARDATDLTMISVSRLEAMDEELRGMAHAVRKRDRDLDRDEVIDLDMATTLGTIVHSVLERVDFRHAEAWPEILQNAAMQNRDNPNDELIGQARTMLGRFFASELAHELASAHLMYREIDFLLPWPLHRSDVTTTSSPPAPLIAGIIDLLVETDAGFLILDYKTGDFPLQASDEQLLAPYELQLGIYAHAVEQWFGSPPRELSLITFKPKVRRITLPWSATRWEEIRNRVDRAMAVLRSPAD
jgi:ATP-dependent helicase/nuclease subunit A